MFNGSKNSPSPGNLEITFTFHALQWKGEVLPPLETEVLDKLQEKYPLQVNGGDGDIMRTILSRTDQITTRARKSSEPPLFLNVFMHLSSGYPTLLPRIQFWVDGSVRVRQTNYWDLMSDIKSLVPEQSVVCRTEMVTLRTGDPLERSINLSTLIGSMMATTEFRSFNLPDGDTGIGGMQENESYSVSQGLRSLLIFSDPR